MNEEKLKVYVAAQAIEVPQDQVECEVSAIICEMQCRRRYENLAGNGPLTYSQRELEKQMDDIRLEAVQTVKTRLVIQQVVEEQHIEATPQELEDEARAIAERKQVSFDMVKGFLGADFGMLRSDLKERKAIAYICDQMQRSTHM